jgi:hypothetical protein
VESIAEPPQNEGATVVELRDVNMSILDADGSPVDAYVFGSALHSATPNDLDLLIVYPRGMSAHDALALRRRVKALVGKKLGVIAHIVLLSAAEELEVSFVAKERCLNVLDLVE